MKEVYLAILLWNLVVFLLYGTDKMLAKMEKRRISEKTLLASAFLMGGIGAFLGMELFRHKTKKPKFCVLIPFFCVAQLGLVGFITKNPTYSIYFQNFFDFFAK